MGLQIDDALSGLKFVGELLFLSAYGSAKSDAALLDADLVLLKESFLCAQPAEANVLVSLKTDCA